jgi:hypothetical protein
MRCFGQGDTPRAMSVIANSAPVHSAEHDRRTRTEQHNSQRPQRIIETANRFNPTAA